MLISAPKTQKLVTSPQRPCVCCVAVRIARFAFIRLTFVPHGTAEWLARVNSRRNVCRVKNAMKLGICSCKAFGEKQRETCREKLWHFRASFLEERATLKFHRKFHTIFHGDFHARCQEKISRQHFCKPCRDGLTAFAER